MCKLQTLRTNCGTDVLVADIKKACIENIIQAAFACEKIDAIYLFGSALELRCKNTSDIDIAIVSNVTRAKLFNTKSYNDFTSKVYAKDIYQDYDILQFDSEEKMFSGSAIGNEIKQKGQLIYKRENSYV